MAGPDDASASSQDCVSPSAGAIVRPRCRSRVVPVAQADDAEDESAEPLDTRQIPVAGLTSARVNALHRGWVERRHFVALVWPPRDQHALATWLRVSEYVKADLQWLLARPYHCFWSQVVYDLLLSECLDTTLQNLPRPHQLHQLPHAPTTRPLLVTIAELLLRVLLRMSTYKESRQHHMTAQFFGRLVYDHYVWHVGRLLDLCSVYGQTNGELVSRLLSSLYTQQPSYWRDTDALAASLPALLEQIAVGTGTSPAAGALALVQDVGWTLMSLLSCHRPVARRFVTAALPTHLARFYETVVPRLQRRLAELRETSGEQTLPLLTADADQSQPNTTQSDSGDVDRQLYLARCWLLKSFRLMVETCWLSELSVEWSAAGLEEGQQQQQLPAGAAPVDDYLHLLTDCLCEQVFVHDLNVMFPVSLDLELIANCCPSIDPERMVYIVDALKSTEDTAAGDADGSDTAVCHAAAAASQVDRPACSEPHAPHSSGVRQEWDSAGGGGTGSCDLSQVELQSMISSVQDLLPDVSEQFVAACLRYYHYHIEDVINALLEDSLPEELACLDRDSAPLPVPPEPPRDERPGSGVAAASSETVDLDDQIALRLPGGGKARGNDHLQRQLEDRSMLQDPAVRQRFAQLANLYEDEYDDSYDAIGAMSASTTLADSCEPDEALVRPFQRITLNNALPSTKWRQRHFDDDENDNDDEDVRDSGAVGHSARGQFVEDPSVVRQRRQQELERKKLARRGRGGGHKGRSGDGSASNNMPAHNAAESFDNSSQSNCTNTTNNNNNNNNNSVCPSYYDGSGRGGSRGRGQKHTFTRDTSGNEQPASAHPSHSAVNRPREQEGGDQTRSRDVVGRAKGQGQTKDVLHNRRVKSVHKGTQHRRGHDRKTRGGTFC